MYVVYPLFLLVFTSVCIELHDRNFKPLVLAWKPFRKIFIRLQNTWDPTASIIHSFSTFTLLYASKLLFITSYLIYPTTFYHLVPSSVSYFTTELREYFIPVTKFILSIICSMCPAALFFLPFSLCVQHFCSVYILLKFSGDFCSVVFLQSYN